MHPIIKRVKLFSLALIVSIFGCVAVCHAIVIPSSDVPHAIPDNNAVGITSTLSGPNLIITDVNLIIGSLTHTCVPDLHVELTSPNGTNVTLLKSFTESGIFTGIGCPSDFIGTILDDDSPTNLLSGISPWTGSFNVDHASSSIISPLTTFDGENALGTWSLFISDLAGADIGTLNSWSIEINGVPEPATLALLGAGLAGLGFSRRKKGAYR